MKKEKQKFEITSQSKDTCSDFWDTLYKSISISLETHKLGYIFIWSITIRDLNWILAHSRLSKQREGGTRVSGPCSIKNFRFEKLRLFAKRSVKLAVYQIFCWCLDRFSQLDALLWKNMFNSQVYSLWNITWRIKASW